MNTTWKFESEADPDLLAEIKSIRASVGDGLNDDELTRLLRESPLPVQAGFAFLSFSKGVVTLSVPPQDLEKWYPKVGWIHPAKETLARTLARKYDLTLFEPPDFDHSYLSPHSGSPNQHHHIELARGQETIVVAHPLYLKVRLYREGATGSPNVIPIAPFFGPQFLEDLSSLYQERPHLSDRLMDRFRFPSSP